MARVSSTDTVQQSAPALADLGAIAVAGVFLSNSRLAARKSAIKVRGGPRARGQLGEMSAGSLFLTVLAPPMRTASSKGAS